MKRTEGGEAELNCSLVLLSKGQHSYLVGKQPWAIKASSLNLSPPVLSVSILACGPWLTLIRIQSPKSGFKGSEKRSLKNFSQIPSGPDPGFFQNPFCGQSPLRSGQRSCLISSMDIYWASILYLGLSSMLGTGWCLQFSPPPWGVQVVGEEGWTPSVGPLSAKKGESAGYSGSGSLRWQHNENSRTCGWIQNFLSRLEQFHG